MSGFPRIGIRLFQVMTVVLFPTSHSLSRHVMIGNRTKKVKSLKFTSNAIKFPKFFFMSPKGFMTVMNQSLVPSIKLFICLILRLTCLPL